MSTWVEKQLKESQQPTRFKIMSQTWHELLFLHWEWCSQALQKTLPPDITLDTFEGKAFLGVVPFRMSGVKPTGFPSVYGLSSFYEMNLRTYVKDASGRPGVWFYSLDTSNWLAVKIAQFFFKLPYRYCQATSSKQQTKITYQATVHNQFKSEFNYEVGSHYKVTPGTLDFFLLERYRLFAEHKGQIYTGKVWHLPYEPQQISLNHCQLDIFESNRFSSPNLNHCHHQCFVKKVNVSIYPLDKL